MPTYVFDVTLRVAASTEKEARSLMTAALDCASINAGEINGEPLLGEASLEGDLDLGEVIEDAQPAMTEREALVKVITHLVGQGWAVVGVNDGGEKISAKGKTVEQVVDDADGVDEAWITFTCGHATGTLWLVWGNSPIELIADHTTADGFGDAVDAAQLSVWPNYPEE